MDDLLRLERKLDDIGGDLDTLRDRLYDEIASRRVKALRPLDGPQPESVEDRVRYRLRHHMHPDIADLRELFERWYGKL